MPKILLIGNGAREHAIAEAITRSAQKPRLFSFMKANNPGIAALSEKTMMGSYSDLDAITRFAAEHKIEFAVIGPEDPLNNGVVDALAESNIPAVGPTKNWRGWKLPNRLHGICSANTISPAIRGSKFFKRSTAWRIFSINWKVSF